MDATQHRGIEDHPDELLAGTHKTRKSTSSSGTSDQDFDVGYGHFLRRFALWIAIIAGVLACGVMILLLVHTGFDFWTGVLKDHFLGTIGLTGLAALAFGIVIFLRQSEGPIDFEAMGLKFKGAAGQVVMWMLCLIALSLCAKLLW